MVMNAEEESVAAEMKTEEIASIDDEYITDEFRHWLEQERAKLEGGRGKTWEQFAWDGGITPAYISRIFHHQNRMGLKFFRAVARNLDMTVGQVYMRYKNVRGRTDQEDRIARKIASLSVGHQRLVEGVIDGLIRGAEEDGALSDDHNTKKGKGPK